MRGRATRRSRDLLLQPRNVAGTYDGAPISALEDKVIPVLRPLSTILIAALVALSPAVLPSTAGAGLALDPVVGQLVDSTTGAPAVGTTLRLHADDGGTPGAVVVTDVTDANGEFSLAPTGPGDYWVEVVRNSRIQGGYVSDRASGPSWVEFDPAYATPVTPGRRLGRVMALPSFISGVVVNAANGNRLGGITVNTREVTSLSTVVGSDTTDSNGFFRIPIAGEDFGLRVNGVSRGFEAGWRACDATVVRTWGAACGSPIGRIGKVFLDRV